MVSRSSFSRRVDDMARAPPTIFFSGRSARLLPRNVPDRTGRTPEYKLRPAFGAPRRSEVPFPPSRPRVNARHDEFSGLATHRHPGLSTQLNRAAGQEPGAEADGEAPVRQAQAVGVTVRGNDRSRASTAGSPAGPTPSLARSARHASRGPPPERSDHSGPGGSDVASVRALSRAARASYTTPRKE